MLQLISRKRTPERVAWERFSVTVEGDTSEKKLINSLEIGNYPRYTKDGERVIYTPLETKLYLLNYLMVVHRELSLPTVQQVLEAFEKAPADVKNEAVAFEFHHGFYDFAATDFFELAQEGKWVTIVALLTEKNTGKELPGVKLKLERPIGISDKQWKQLYLKYSHPFYEYIDQ